MEWKRFSRVAAAGTLVVSVLLSAACAPDAGSDLAATAPVAGSVVDSSGGQVDLPQEVPGLPVAGGPTHITVAGQTGQVVPIGITDDGVLAPPTDVSLTGWYLDSALPGSGGPGSVVLTGHINEVGQGWGFASNFVEITAGEEITITTDAGGEVTYRAVSGSEHDLKADGVAEIVNDFTGPERLVVITCGGRYVGGELGYESNIVTVFEPVSV